MIERTLILEGTGRSLRLGAGETLLDGLERNGYRMRRSCRNGVCEICQITLLEGEVVQRYPAATLQGPTADVLACTATALSDLRVEIEGLRMPGVLAVKKLTCDISAIEKLNHDVYRVRLHLPATGSLATEFYAGQYLDIVLPDGKQASFSIGSAPEMGRELELHIRHIPDSAMSTAIVEHLLNQPSVQIELPKGDCYLKATEVAADTRLILAAASTGFAQVKSIVEHLLANQHSNPIHIYWAVRSADDFYLDKLPEQWAREHTHVMMHHVVSEPDGSPDWAGRTGLITEAILEDFSDFDDVEVIASGSPGMVYALLDALEAKGLKQEQMKSDVFAYAPRPK
ncbi:2Fe-2S iron-sulfur cluster-binding protein [Marinobacterium arenosum]|uniref:2Fe-2S iron-sulfur cluster-binding protein n=1 Tax=Marinobacterium arenosum TaxID=2862496 RepID=UPI001C94ECE5|nr:2Fe-2S iron-sulfur cluster-binding protein [Marinobacterium arenosum]MBY4676916.1 2Fe-2S iron-sulfur cluster binding domain-containing protein [Marinobacterium arenosum]